MMASGDGAALATFDLSFPDQLRPLFSKLQPDFLVRVEGHPSHLVARLGLRAIVFDQKLEGGSIRQTKFHRQNSLNRSADSSDRVLDVLVAKISLPRPSVMPLVGHGQGKTTETNATPDWGVCCRAAARSWLSRTWISSAFICAT